MGSKSLLRSFVFLSMTALVFSGCETNNYNVQPEVKAASSVSEVFKLEGEHVSIQKNKLEEEYLLQGSIVGPAMAPAFENMRSRIVTFRKKPGRLYMFQAKKGHIVYDDMPSELILTTFPIVNEDDSKVVVNFNAGMSALFSAGDWSVQDYSGSSYRTDFGKIATSVAYIESADVDSPHNRFILVQVAQLPSFQNQTYRIKYYFQPYEENKDFRKLISKDFVRSGFFEIPPLLRDNGDADVYVAKFDERKPITFAVSASAPKNMRDAIKEGVLYWNGIAGREIVKVVDAPEGVTAPDFNYNLIQWIEWDGAQSAYADAQMDPRTGEVLHGQVFMTSVFSFWSSHRARAILRKLRTKKYELEAEHRRFGLRGFMNAVRCDMNSNQELRATLEDILSRGLEDDVILKLSQDYVRNTIAHEIGHVLGLRHNFAGSLATNYKPGDVMPLLEDYIIQRKAPRDLITTSSVMDYEDRYNRYLTGDLVKNVADHPKAFAYDRAAIDYLFNGKEISGYNTPLFCTDSQTGPDQAPSQRMYVDCRRYDSGKSLSDHATSVLNLGIRDVPNLLAETFIDAAFPYEGDVPTPVDQVVLDPGPTAFKLLDYYEGARSSIVHAMTDSGNILQVQRRFGSVDESNREVVRRAEADFLANDIASEGGMQRVLSDIPSDLASRWSSDFNRIIENAVYQSGKAMSSRFEFKPADREIMKERARIYFNELYRMLVELDLTILSGATLPHDSHLIDNSLTDDFSTLLGNRVKRYTFSKDRDGNYVYKFEIRKLAAQLLQPGRGQNPKWVANGLKIYSKELRELEKNVERVNNALKNNRKISDQDVTRYLEDKEVLQAFYVPWKSATE